MAYGSVIPLLHINSVAHEFQSPQRTQTPVEPSRASLLKQTMWSLMIICWECTPCRKLRIHIFDILPNSNTWQCHEKMKLTQATCSSGSSSASWNVRF